MSTVSHPASVTPAVGGHGEGLSAAGPRQGGNEGSPWTLVPSLLGGRQQGSGSEEKLKLAYGGVVTSAAPVADTDGQFMVHQRTAW